MRLILKTALTAALLISHFVATTVYAHETPPPNWKYLDTFANVPVVDSAVVVAANFAVNTRPVTLVDIVAARKQLVKAKTIVLCLRVKSKGAGSPSRLVMAKVFKSTNQPYQLKSWTRVNSCIFND
jgi:hypothetical protein